MAKLFSVKILTPQNKIYEGEVSSLVVPAELGYLGVLANHAPLASLLTPGKIMLKDASGETKTIVSQDKGFLEVFHNRVTLLLG